MKLLRVIKIRKDSKLSGGFGIALGIRSFSRPAKSIENSYSGRYTLLESGIYLPEETFECSFTSMHRLLTEDLEKFETTYIPTSFGATPAVFFSRICFCM